MILFVILYFYDTGIDKENDYGSVVLKFTCILALHLMQQPEIKNSIKRLKYILHHPDAFEQLFIPQLICWLKFFSEFIIQVAMIVCTAFENYDVAIILDFSALVVVNYVDIYYFNTLTDDLKQQASEVDFSMPVRNTKVSFKQLDLKGKVFFITLMIVEWVYETIYYHFLPYLAVLYAFYGVIQYW